VKEEMLYLFCYNRLFKITERNKIGFSYNLEQEDIQKLIEIFEKKSIPYTTELKKENRVINKNGECCNTKIVIEIDNKQYNIANYNSYLIRYSVANMISKAFNRKEIKAKCYVSGRR
jgi:hypothetical protein